MEGTAADVESAGQQQESHKHIKDILREAEELTKQHELCYPTALDFGDQGKSPDITETGGLDSSSMPGAIAKPFLRVLLVDRFKQHLDGSRHGIFFNVLTGPQKISFLGQVFENEPELLQPQMRRRDLGYYPSPAGCVLLMSRRWHIVTACEAKSTGNDGYWHVIVVASVLHGNSRAIPELGLLDTFKNVSREWPKDITGLVTAVKSTIAQALTRNFIFSLDRALQFHIHMFEEPHAFRGTYGTALWGNERSLHLDDSMLVDWQDLHDTIFRHEEAYENAAKWCGSSLPQANDIDTLLRKATRLEKRIHEQVQIRASAVSIEESRRAIMQSQSVGRLTQLAFVFLPLTFTTGVFGMNITPFGGDAPMWKFWITSAMIGIGALLVWAIAGRLERAWMTREKLREARARNYRGPTVLRGLFYIWWTFGPSSSFDAA